MTTLQAIAEQLAAALRPYPCRAVPGYDGKMRRICRHCESLAAFDAYVLEKIATEEAG